MAARIWSLVSLLDGLALQARPSMTAAPHWALRHAGAARFVSPLSVIVLILILIFFFVGLTIFARRCGKEEPVHAQSDHDHRDNR